MLASPRALRTLLPLLATASLGIVAAAPVGAQSPADGARALVVVVHGMGRTPRSMQPVVESLEEEGYDVLNFGYSSTCCSVAELGRQLRAAVDARMTPQHTAVHFVGHSLGNIIVRWMLTRDPPPPRVGRVVMIAPPNGGSRAADRYASLVGWLLEPIDELRTDSSSTVRRLPPMRGVEVGVIAGRRDGKVRIDETHLAEETEHVVVEGYHSFLMRRAEVHRLTREFLRDGRFGAAQRADTAP